MGDRKNGEFSVKISYKLLGPQHVITTLWPWQLIWKLKKKVSNGKQVLYVHEGSIVTKPSFYTSSVASDLWSMFITLFGLNWFMHRVSRMVFESWSCWKVYITIRRIWMMIPATIFWNIWNESNRRCFDGISTTYQSLKASCLMLLYSWVYNSPIDSCVTLLNFISLLALN
ncbi:hypothetical protein H5410_050577 [Solanum commersonii]|uniref:Uncharacterized protein n=1 Tax=Solanum commersonii TaxID=4109 RepID=A0A9J5WYA8_SOLCO|nr:hypothetical protein H5410_050577 [Solanum commersonii]